MKRIKIFQENSETIEILDSDSQDLRDYTIETSRLLEVSNVSILETSSGNVIVRPNKVTSILVDEVIENKEEKVEEPKEEIVEDIITDEE